ncbi:MAG: response regulator [Endomicrobiales bacterium]|jgi:signal transduction histidine kinase/FixJ family two-component response regulator
MYNILVVDDEPNILQLCKVILTSPEVAVSTLTTGSDALNVMHSETFDLVLADLNMPAMNGMELLKKIKKFFPETAVIILTGLGTVDSAVEALKNGAYDYLLKPFEAEGLEKSVHKCLEHNRLLKHEDILQKTLYLYRFSQEITPSSTEKELRNFIVTNAMQAVGADSGSLFMRASSEGPLCLETAIGQDLPVGCQLNGDGKIANWVLNNNKALLIQHAVNALPQFSDIPNREEIVSSLVVPLLTDKFSIGVICLNRFKQKSNYLFSSHDLEAMHTFALHASLVVTGLRHARELRELDKMKSWFVSNVSHEIRTPITAISGALNLLKTSCSFNTQQGKPALFLDLITRNIDRIQYLINDLLDFSRMEHGQLKLVYSFFNLNDVLGEVTQDIELLFKDKHLIITMELPDTVKDIFGDRDKISQVMTNLMGNAAKFTPENGQITIGYVFTDDVRLLLYVKDSGPGIASDQFEKVFEKFYQIDGSLQREHGGFGLGLAIVKTIIEKHNGKIWVESENGKGASFFIDMPYVPATPVA